MDLKTSGIIAGFGVTMAARFVPEEWRQVRIVGAVVGILMIAQFPIILVAKFAPHNAPVLRPLFILSGCLCAAVIMAIGLIFLIPPIWRPLWRFVPSWLSPTVPLSEAAGYLFGETRNTLSVELAERFSRSPSREDMLDAMGNLIVHHVDILVRRVPSPKWERFPKTRIKNMSVSHGASGMQKHGEKELYYVDPRVKWSDLFKVVREVRALHKLGQKEIEEQLTQAKPSNLN